MKRSVSSPLFIVFTLVTLGGLAVAAQQKPAPPSFPTNAVFDQIKTLAGEWEGSFEGKTGGTSYRVVSAGSAVMNVLKAEDGTDMVTVIHPDGGDVMATHYCAIGNQPRMVAHGAVKPGVIRFVFKDVTNLAAPNAAHMRELTLVLVDATHHRQEWTSRDKDGKDQTQVFEFTRKR